MSDKSPTLKGPWSDDAIHGFLEETCVPVRLACNGTAGHPVMASLWYLPEDGRIWCATQQGSSVASLIARDGRCAFEVSLESAPYRGVRGQGTATLHADRGEEILRKLMNRYLGDATPRLSEKLLSRVSTETAIAIEPESVFSWDYAKRMREVA